MEREGFFYAHTESLDLGGGTDLEIHRKPSNSVEAFAFRPLPPFSSNPPVPSQFKPSQATEGSSKLDMSPYPEKKSSQNLEKFFLAHEPV